MTAAQRWLAFDINVGSDAVDLRYGCVPAPGTWKLIKAYWTPATTLATNGTVYHTVTIKKGITGGTVATLGSLSTAAVTDTAGTPREFTLVTSSDAEFAGGVDPIEITADGTPSTGAVTDGCVTLLFAKVHGS